MAALPPQPAQQTMGAGLLAGLALAGLLLAQKPPSKQAERLLEIGVKVGEVTSQSALLWTRAPPIDLFDPDKKASWIRVLSNMLRGGEMQVRYRISQDPGLLRARWSRWQFVDEEDDYIHQFELDDLESGAAYHFEVQAADANGNAVHTPRVGEFRTAPAADADTPVVFTVITGQRYDRLDDPRGFRIYPAMERLNPDFLVLTGDTVYLDRGRTPAVTYRQALFRWRRMYELPWLSAFHLHVPAYWEKDDHDILQDDAYPGIKPYGQLTFEQGLELFRLQTPQNGRPYRRVRWGRLAEVWLTEVREFRSPNRSKDGPKKSIFGAEQKRWLKDTLQASDAPWRILINPTPIVGPDRAEGKADNHANHAFRTEGDEIREFLAGLGDNVLLIAGDRHWQYHSVHPGTGLHEIGCGPASDAHAGGSPGFDPEYHQFHREQGGFLSVSIGVEGRETVATIRLHDVDGDVVHEYSRRRPLR